MHVFTRKVNERILIGDALVTIVAIGPSRVRLTVDAPQTLKVVREEVVNPPTSQSQGGVDRPARLARRR